MPLKSVISAPEFFRTANQREAFRLVRLINRIEPHKANLRDDYQRIKFLAMQEKQNSKIEEWINEKIQRTYIKVNANYFPNCSIDTRWTDIKKTGL